MAYLILAGGGRARQIKKPPNPTTSRNAERQKVLPPPASDCHSLPEWLSSPSRIRTSAELSGNNGDCQVAGPFSGPIGHDLHSSEGGGTEGGIERIVRQLAALTAAERQALKAMLELLG